ncbi:hypothetical protein [Dongia mobilis]|uniref:hypothetical protein n=1 Tax=Dongia sp. TaxID=1977262 RepID=UPI0026EF36EA
MYSESDIESAVAAGVITAEAVAALRDHVARNRSTVLVDEESFRLLTGFNDIFVVIAISLLLVALAWIGTGIHQALGGAAVAAASWALAEFFTRKRRMALPSIQLLLAFVGGVFSTVGGAVVSYGGVLEDRTNAMLAATAAAAAAGAAYLHWRRFQVPITVAAGAIAVVGVGLALVFVAVPALLAQIHWFVLLGGLCLFAFAMHWDMSDRERRTRRSDVAFWLHLAAAPMIAHPIFLQLGVFGGNVSGGRAAVVVALYIVMALVSLAVDRRAMLVSALTYVLYAISALFESFGAIGINVALTALVIGSALLLLSAFWHVARRRVVRLLPPDWQTRLPALDRPAVTAQPH